MPATPPATTKLFVAVHGIGDQTAYETIQSVALQVTRHYGTPVSLPLGRFYPPSTTGLNPGQQIAPGQKDLH